MTLQTIRETKNDRIATAVRTALGLLFVMTGVMKLAIPPLGAAFAGQLAAANIPFEEVQRWVVPLVEIGVGVALFVGYYTRIATLMVLNNMVVATYVHLMVDDPALFPLQPTEPIIPAVVTILSAYVLLRGGGSRSLDLSAS